MDINHLRALVHEDFDAVNTLIVNNIQSQIPLLDNLANHIIQSGGKRLRPLLVLLASHACEYKGRDHIILAAMVEFFHTATLLHDDVVDESTMRRGKETANEIWGSKACILVGDYLLTQQMQMMVNVGHLEIMRLMANVAHEMGCCEIKQLANKHKTAPSEADYFDVIRGKTSLLFAASASMGAMIAGADVSVQQGLYHFGLHLGNAFQLIDDALDYCSDVKTIGKNIGDDLAEGKATLPLLHVLKEGTEAQKTMVKQSLVQGTLDHLTEILDAISETKAISYTQGMAALEIDKAIAHLDVLAPSSYKEALINLAQFAIKRDH